MSGARNISSLGVLVLCDGSMACRALVRLLSSLGFDVVTIGRDAFRKRFSPSPKRLSMVDVVIIDLDGAAELYPICDAMMRLDERPALLIISDVHHPFLKDDTAEPASISLLQRPFSASVLQGKIFSLVAA